MFRGITAILLDEKGRLAIPMRYRTQLLSEAQGQLVATIDTEVKCLLLYPLYAWIEIEKKLEALPSFNRAARRIQRLLMGHATELEMDAQGRFVLPQPLRAYAGLDKDIVLVGQGKKFEIWDQAQWNELREGWLEQGLDSGGSLPENLESLSL